MTKKRTLGPHVNDPGVDKLTFILPWRQGPKYLGELPEPVEERISQALADGTCKPWYAKGRRYLFSLIYRFSNGSEAKIQIGATRPEVQKGGIRIELNPSSLTKKDFLALHIFMRGIIGKKYDQSLRAPVINRVDFAVDIDNLLLGDVLVDYEHSQRVTMFGKRIIRGGTIETLNFGSVSSAYISTVYDKSTQLLDKLLKELGREGMRSDELSQNCIKQLISAKKRTPTVRVEVRGKKLGLPLSKLIDQPNRFSRFKFASVAGLDELSDFNRVSFLALYRDMGMKAALAAFSGKKVHAKLKALTSVQPAWWQSDDLWARSCECLRSAGVFPAAAFGAEDDEES